MKHLGLFEGIGGFSLAARWMGWQTVAWCEWNEFGQRVLKCHFPEAEGHGDITKTDFRKYAGAIDIITGGFPCQPYSSAGKRLGTADTRHLWPEMLRAIREVQPRWVVGENVRGLISWNGGLVFDQVQTDLETEGYEVFPVLLPACAVDAPHRRDRIWFVAYRDGARCGSEYELRAGRDLSEKRTDKTGPTSDTAGNRRKRKGTEIAPEEGFKPGSESGRELEGGFERLRGDEPTSDTDSTRLQAAGAEQQATGATGGGLQRSASDTSFIGRQQSGAARSGGPGSTHGRGLVAGPTSDTDSERQECTRKSTRLGRERFSIDNSQSNKSNWENFPTKSPVCVGDDGLPRELDGISFSKWRKESIKAYGNAVVPQLVLQIYNAIEQYETTNI